MGLQFRMSVVSRVGFLRSGFILAVLKVKGELMSFTFWVKWVTKSSAVKE